MPFLPMLASSSARYWLWTLEGCNYCGVQHVG